jgi:hypothetical protein
MKNQAQKNVRPIAKVIVAKSDKQKGGRIHEIDDIIGLLDDM